MVTCPSPRDLDAVREHAEGGCAACARRVAMLGNTTVAPTITPATEDTALATQQTQAPSRSSMRLLALGERIGRYEIVSVLGSGGMGVVYAARDTQLDRRVAVKVLRSGFARNIQGAKQMLVDEAKAMAKLSHRNVVMVHDVGVHDEQVFLAMELVEGETLRERMRGQRSPAPRGAEEEATVRVRRPKLAPPTTTTTGGLMEILLEAGRGLAAAHRAGLVHRDFKPENVLIGRDGRVCVSDFGVARSAAVGSDDVAGTPMYMAPEAHDGVVDPRSDQYSFCLTLVEALGGVAPPKPEHVATLRVTPRVKRALTRGLAARPDERFASMDALFAELAPSTKRRPAAIVMGAAGAVAIGAAVIAFVVGRGTTMGPTCGAAESEASAVWSPLQAFEVRAAFGDDARVGKAARELDAWRQRWVGQHTRVCRATHIDGTQSLELLDLKMACLRDRAAAVGAIVAQLTAGDRGALAFAGQSVPAAGNTTACEGDRESLRSFAALGDAATSTTQKALHAELATVEANNHAGRYRKVAPAADALAAKADTAALALISASARFFAGMARAQLGDRVAAIAAFRTASLDADRAGNDELRLKIQLALARVLELEARLDAADEALAAADAMVARLGNRTDLVATVRTARSQMAFVRGDYAKALADASAALDTLEKAGLGDEVPGRAARLEAAMSIEALGRLPEAHKAYEEAIGRNVARLGADAPDTALVIAHLASLEMREGKPQSAIEHLVAALRVLDDAFGDDAQQTIAWRGELASAYVLTEQIDKARATLAKGIAVSEATGAGPERAMLYTSLGDIERGAGNFTGAVNAYDLAVTTLENRWGAEHPALVEYLARRGDARRLTHDFAGAEADLARAEDIIKANGGVDLDQFEYFRGQVAVDAQRLDEGRAHFEACIAARTKETQAQMTALCEMGLANVIAAHERPRALRLLRHARAVFTEAGDTETVRDIDAMLQRL